MSTEELRQYIYPDETIEQAREAIAAISASTADVRIIADDISG